MDVLNLQLGIYIYTWRTNMKTMLKLTFLSLMMVSLSSFAETITITGSPVPLEQREEVYFTPPNYTFDNSYHYVVVNGTNRVCYAEKQPNLATLDEVDIQVNVAGEVATWHCYAYSPDYFTVTTP